MPTFRVVLNLCMLLGVAFLGFRFFWMLVMAFFRGVIRASRLPQAFLFMPGYAGWGYVAALLALSAALQMKLLVPEGWVSYQTAAFFLLTLFMLAERVDSFYYAYRDQDPGYQRIVRWQHYLAMGLWLIAGWLILTGKAFFQIPVVEAYVKNIQQLLLTPGWGIWLGIVGLGYELILLKFIIRSARRGTRGIQPFPERWRN